MVASFVLPLLLNLIVQLPSHLGEQEREALLTACNQAYFPRQCFAAEGDEAGQAKIEQVSSERFLLEIVLQTAKKERLISREFTFKTEDEPLERARSLGLSLGLLARTTESIAEPETPMEAHQAKEGGQDVSNEEILKPEQATQGSVRKPTYSPPPFSKSKDSGTKNPPHFSTELQLALAFEPQLVTALPGGSLKFLYEASRYLQVSVSAHLSGTKKRFEATTMRLVSTRPMLGLRLLLPKESWSVGLELEIGAESLSISTANPKSRGSGWSPAMQVGVPMQLQISELSYFLLAAQIKVTPSVTEISLDEVPLATTALAIPLASVGFGLRF